LIDTHCHLLPAIDDGARSMNMALAMAAGAAECGIREIMCTPHHLNGVFTNLRDDILTQIVYLQEQIIAAGLELSLHPGAELHLVPELPQQLLEGSALTYADRGCAALVELPKSTVPQGTDLLLEQILYQGITPVIAHPERNRELLRQPERVGEWVQWGCALQLTAQSCSGAFGKPLQQVCRYWCQRGWVHLVASDAHRPQGRSPDTLAAAYPTLVYWLGADSARLLTHDNPQRLLAGEALQAAPKVIQSARRSWWRWPWFQ